MKKFQDEVHDVLAKYAKDNQGKEDHINDRVIINNILKSYQSQQPRKTIRTKKESLIRLIDILFPKRLL